MEKDEVISSNCPVRVHFLNVFLHNAHVKCYTCIPCWNKQQPFTTIYKLKMGSLSSKWKGALNAEYKLSINTKIDRYTTTMFTGQCLVVFLGNILLRRHSRWFWELLVTTNTDEHVSHIRRRHRAKAKLFFDIIFTAIRSVWIYLNEKLYCDSLTWILSYLFSLALFHFLYIILWKIKVNTGNSKIDSVISTSILPRMSLTYLVIGSPHTHTQRQTDRQNLCVCLPVLTIWTLTYPPTIRIRLIKAFVGMLNQSISKLKTSITARKSSCRKVMFSCWDTPTRQTPPGKTPPLGRHPHGHNPQGQTPPPGQTSLCRQPPGRHPAANTPWADIPPTDTPWA